MARLLVTSVRKVTAKHKANMVRMIGSKARFSSAPPISALKPEFVKAVAMLMLDPNRIRTPKEFSRRWPSRGVFGLHRSFCLSPHWEQ